MRYLFYIGQNYSFEILRPVQTAANKRGDEVAWFVEGGEVNLAYFRPDERRLTSIAAVQDFAPDAVLVPGNLVPNFIPGLKVQVFHGFEWKKKGHFRMRGMFDLYCTQGPLFTGKFEQLREQHPHFDVIETGWPKVDPLFMSPAYAWPGKLKSPVVLYAPTFSPALTSAEALFEQIKALVKTGRWQWLFKFHPKMDSNWIERYRSLEGEHCHIVDTDTLAPVLQAADVMLSDTSSIITEFALLNRPVVTFNNKSPEPHLINITEADKLAHAIEQGLNADDAHKALIADNVAQLHPYQDGRSSERLLDAIDSALATGRRGLKSKPLNILRNLKMRKKFAYWRP